MARTSIVDGEQALALEAPSTSLRTAFSARAVVKSVNKSRCSSGYATVTPPPLNAEVLPDDAGAHRAVSAGASNFRTLAGYRENSAYGIIFIAHYDVAEP
jgi:hypothetical protein